MCWGCENPDGDYLREVVEPLIARSGWMVQVVGGNRLRAPLAYTVGLTERGLPELVVTGLRAADAAELLNAVGPRPGLWAGEQFVLSGRAIEVVDVPHPDAHLFIADEMYGPALAALQLVWTDDRGHWPWCRGHRAGRGGQPVLGPRARPAA